MPFDSSTDLLGRWRQGDAKAGAQLIEEYGDALYGFFVPKVGAVAEDLMQQVFAAMLAGADRFEGKASLRTYVFAIARRQLYSYYRDQRRHPSMAPSPGPMPALQTSPSAQAATAETNQLLYRAMAGLPDAQRAVLDLAYWQQLSPEQIAEVLEVPRNTVYTRIRRARDRLRQALIELAPGVEAIVADVMPTPFSAP